MRKKIGNIIRKVKPVNKKKIDTLFLETTNRCNGNCIMCTHQFSKRPPQDMKLKDAKHILLQIKPKQTILHLFGDPLLYPDLDEVIKTAKYVNSKAVLDTNAQLLTPKRFTSLSLAGLDRLVISFGATTKEVYEKIWRGCNFEVVTNNIRGVYKTKKEFNLKTKIIIRTIITNENRKQLKKIKKTWSKYCDRWESCEEFHLYGYDRTPLTYRKPDCQQTQKLWRECVVKSNGDVVPCCCDLDGEYVFGNAFEENIFDIWNGSKMNSFRNEVYNIENRMPKIPICRECILCPRVDKQ